jgi:hypothetical protein
VRLHRFQQSRFRRTKFPPEKTVVGTAAAVRVTPAPRDRRRAAGRVLRTLGCPYVEFIELPGVTVHPGERELLPQFHGVSVVGLDRPSRPSLLQRAVSMCTDNARRSFSFRQPSQLLRGGAAAVPRDRDLPVRRRADSTRSWQYCPSRARPTRAARTGCAGK